MRGLLRLTWLEIKIFAREPMGVIGTVAMPVMFFVLFTRLMRIRRPPRLPRAAFGVFDPAFLPVLVAMLITISAVASLVTIISVYREGGILKRLRATPLRPTTILTAHVLAKLLYTLVTALLMIGAGRRYYPAGVDFPVVHFAAALLLTTWSILSIGFLIASLVSSARFAQPLASLILYPMVGVSGLFVPIEVMPPPLQGIAELLPTTQAVSMLLVIWHCDVWAQHSADVLALVVTFGVCTALSSLVFRWE
jgi:ABC-2 type transport system permease protein